MKNVMKIVGSLCLVMLLAGAAHAQRKSYDVSGFTKVTYGLPGTLELTQGSTFSVALEGDDDDLERISVEVKNGSLVIGVEGGWRRMGKINAYVTLPALEAAVLSGSGKIVSSDEWTAKNMSVVVSGSGSVDMMVKSTDLQTVISGSGSIELAGSSEGINLVISGSGKFAGFDLATNDCSIVISGSGSANVQVDGELDARITGSGDVVYRGSPDHVNASTLGSGSVRKN